MKIIFHKNFEKQYVKLSKSLKTKVKARIVIFQGEQYNIILNNHALHGKFTGYRSLNATGDIRIIYKMVDNNSVIFTDIGSHSKLYS